MNQDDGDFRSTLNPMQWGELFGLAKLAEATSIPDTTLRRVLLGMHQREPLLQLDRIASATQAWCRLRPKVEGAPCSLAAWRFLWQRQHNLMAGER